MVILCRGLPDLSQNYAFDCHPKKQSHVSECQIYQKRMEDVETVRGVTGSFQITPRTGKMHSELGCKSMK